MNSRRIIYMTVAIVLTLSAVVIIAPMMFPYISNGVCAIAGLLVGFAAAAIFQHYNDNE